MFRINFYEFYTMYNKNYSNSLGMISLTFIKIMKQKINKQKMLVILLNNIPQYFKNHFDTC